MDTIATDLDRLATSRVDERAADRVEDDVVADVRELQGPWRHETRAVARPADLGVLFEDGDVEAGLGHVPRDPAARRAGTDD